MSDDSKEASEEFWDAVIHSGSGIIECESCKRIHYSEDAITIQDYFESEQDKEEFLKKAEENPDKYVYHDYSSVSWGTANGMDIICGCPCGMAKKIEDFMWSHRFIFADYFKNKATRIKKDADTDYGLAKETKELSENLEKLKSIKIDLQKQGKLTRKIDF